jgi:hypothetical protein
MEGIPEEEMGELLEEEVVDEEGDVPRPLGPFMTPQPSAVRASSVLSAQSGLSAQGPQRIRVMEPWKVRDIVVPQPLTTSVKKEDPEPREQISGEEKSVGPFTLLHLLPELISAAPTGHTSKTEVRIHDSRSC